MSIAKIKNALKSANDKMAELRSAITEYDDEGRSLRAKLNASATVPFRAGTWGSRWPISPSKEAGKIS